MEHWWISIVSFLTTPGFTAIANVTGVLGFVFTLVVFFNVRTIASHYSSLVRLPQLRLSLTNQASAIGAGLSDFENQKDTISLELAKALPLLVAVKRRLKITQRSTVNSLIKNVAQFRPNSPISELQIRLVFNQLHSLVGELEQWENDSHWSK